MELEDGVLVLRRIRVHYRLLGCAEDKRAAAERAHGVHQAKCPVARSLRGSIEITTDLTLV